MLVLFVAFLSSLTLRIVVNLMRLLSVALVILLIVKVLQLICAVILILCVWIWLRIFFVLVFVVLVLLRLLFTLILILINLIVFGFMNNLIDNTLSLFRAYAPGAARSVARTPRKKGVKTLFRYYVWNFIDKKYRPLSGLYELSKAKELDSLGEIYYKIRFEY